MMKLQSKISLEPKLLLDIIESMSTAVVALNSDNTYFFINIAGLNMLGISNNFPDIKTLKSSVGHHSLESHIKNISDNNPNTNFNLWNFDLGFNWEFAPGSKATLLYRNNIFNENNLSGISYYNSTKDLFKKPLNHQLSLRINYFIDYNLLKKKKS